MQLKCAVVCFVTVSGIAMISGCGQETSTSEAESASGKPAPVTDEAGTSRQASGDPGDGSRELRDRYGIGAAEASSRQSEPATKPAYQMDPVLAERYGLAPTGGAAASGRDETASGGYEMDPLLAERYGLAPPGDAAGSEQDVQPQSNLPLPAGGRRAGTPSAGLAEGILDAEASGDLNQAIEAYRGVIEEFDALRSDAAQAVFRLGEAYRRQGKTTEARSQYGRILREFSDQEELARMSLDRMSDRVQGVQSVTYPALPPTSAISTTPESLKRQLELFQQELELMEQEIRAAEQRAKNGMETFSQVRSLKREALGLKRQIAILEGQIDSANPQHGEEEGEVAVQARISVGAVNDYRVLVAQVNNLMQREAELRLRYTAAHPDMVQARRERAELEAQMKELEAENPGIEELVRSRRE